MSDTDDDAALAAAEAQIEIATRQGLFTIVTDSESQTELVAIARRRGEALARFDDGIDHRECGEGCSDPEVHYRFLWSKAEAENREIRAQIAALAPTSDAAPKEAI